MQFLWCFEWLWYIEELPFLGYLHRTHFRTCSPAGLEFVDGAFRDVHHTIHYCLRHVRVKSVGPAKSLGLIVVKQTKQIYVRCSEESVWLPSIMYLYSVAGVLYIYPNFLPNAEEPSFYMHWLLCLWLWANTTMNYLEAVLRDPGFVLLPSENATWEDYTWCQRCQQGKPPGSHHCRICRRCVHKMDHHCPFIGNCVGRSNRRAFVLFLFWSASSLLYVLSIALIHCLERWPQIEAGLREATEKLPVFNANSLAIYLERILAHTYEGIHLKAIGALLLIAGVTFSMTFSLLIQQLLLISEGQTTVSRLQARRAWRAKVRAEKRGQQLVVMTQRGRRENLEEVFGTAPFWTWPLPRLLVPSVGSAKKVWRKKGVA